MTDRVRFRDRCARARGLRLIALGALLLACLGQASGAAALTRVAPPVLVVENGGDHGNEDPAKNLASFLAHAGYTPTRAKNLPATLGDYTAIWFVGTNPIASSYRGPLEAYVRAGGGLYLTGEGPCCESLNRSDEQLLQHLVAPAPFRVGDGQVVAKPSSSRNLINPLAPDGITELPNTLHLWQPFEPGAMLGLLQFNELTFGYQSAVFPVTTGAAWTSSEVIGGKGHVAVMMDINWLESRYANLGEANAMVANIQRFLAGPAQGTGAYVALGDSYSSGHGNPPFDPAGGGCDRSISYAYPDIIAKDLKLSASNHAFRFQACSGAVTDDITSQDSALGPNTKLVTITVGGDDVHFKDVLIDCMAASAASAAAALRHLSLPNVCTERMSRLGPGVLRNAVSDIHALKAKLEQTYLIIQRHARAASNHIYVLGYPDVFPPDGKASPTCPATTVLAPESIEWLAKLQNDLNDTVKSAADRTGVVYVDPNVANRPYSFLGHDVCALGRAWFHLPVTSTLALNAFGAFHPTRAGQQALANSLIANGATKVKIATSAVGRAAAAAGPRVNRYTERARPGPTSPVATSTAAKARIAVGVSLDETLPQPETTIAGTVTSTAGHALSGIVVTARTSEGSEFDAETAADGRYTIGGLPPGEYTVRFEGGERQFETQWFSGQSEASTAQPLNVSEGEARTGVDAALQPTGGGTIEGHVSDLEGRPLAGAEVLAGAGIAVLTNANGDYAIEGVTPGPYRVFFEDEPSNYISQYYPEASSEVTSREVHVEANGVSRGIDARLEKAATIIGHAKSDIGEPLSGVDVEVDDVNNGFVGATTTAADGSYSMGNLLPGTYTVHFEPVEGNHLGQFYEAQTDAKKAKKLKLASGQTRQGIDATLASGAVLSGTVTNSSGGVGVEKVEVYATSSEGETRTAITTGGGSYAIEGLRQGTYTIRFEPLSGNYLDQFYNEAASADGAEAVTVPAGGNVERINAKLTSGGIVGGHVMAQDTHEPLVGVQVRISSSEASGQTAIATTGEDGSYAVEGLAPGTYDVHFEPNGSAYLGQFYNGKGDNEEPDLVTVGEGASVEEIDASLVPAATVRGSVTDAATEEPVVGVDVDVASDEGGSGGTTTTDENGTYTVTGLAPGTYTVHFKASTGNYAPQYYNAKSGEEQPDGLNLSAGETADANAELSQGASMSGTVSAGGGSPIRGARVTLTGAEGEAGGATTTDQDGSYSITGLAPGNYMAHFEAPGRISRYFSEPSNTEAPTVITLSAGESRQHVDSILEEGATITGTVTDKTTGAGLEDLVVYAYGSQCSAGPAATTTDKEGTYRLEGLAAGSYHVVFNVSGGGHEAQRYKEPVVISATSNATGIDATLTASKLGEAPAFECEEGRAAPEPPEFGTCAKRFGGEFTTSACATGPLGTHAGKFEWIPGVARTGFTGSGGPVKLETPSGIVLRCASQRANGEYSSTKAIESLLVTLTGCTGFGEACTSTGAAPGEIKTTSLVGQLGWESRLQMAAALDLAASDHGTIAGFQCGSEQVAWRGSLIVPVKVGKMSAGFALKFKASKGHQRPEQLEGLPLDILEQQINLLGTEQVGVTATLTLTSEEAIEINPVQ